MTEEEFDDDFVSKSQLKREVEEMQALGERLISLKPAQLEQLDLPESLYDAVVEAKRLNSHGAQRRQRQYIGKLMRQVEIEPIQAQFEEWDRLNRTHLVRFHQLEQWRDRLLTDKQALGELIEQYPQVEIQRIRTLIRNAAKEQAANKPPKSSRELFKLLRELAGE